MSNLEGELKIALRREEPPADFTERVLARLKQPLAEPKWWERLAVLMRPPRLQWVAIAMIVSVVIPAGVQYRRGERAKEQLLFAVRVAGTKLHQAQHKVAETGRMGTRL